MIRRDIFREIPVPGGIPRDPSKLVALGQSVIDLAMVRNGRKWHGINKDSVRSHDDASDFTRIRWNTYLPHGVILSIVDKRKIGAGLLLTVDAMTDDPDICVVQGYVVNDAFPQQGLRRFVNTGLPADACHPLIEALEESSVVVDVDGRNDQKQVEDYVKAIATVLK